MSQFTLTAPCLFGWERLVKNEIEHLGYKVSEVIDGRVSFLGDAAAIARANLFLRTPERVLLELGRFTATSFEDLFQGVDKLPLEDFIGPLDAFPVKGSCLKSKLMSVPDCQRIIKKAAVKRLGGVYGIGRFEESGARMQLQFMILKDEVRLYLDTTGVPLHKRGYRSKSAPAPLRETIAAGMIQLSRYREGIPFYDPMCGGGTIAIEAAMLAADIAPGLGRFFDFDKWDCMPIEAGRQARSEALSRRKSIKEPIIFASDIDTEMVELCKHNAHLAGVSGAIQVKKEDIRRFSPREERGVIVTNPPYGERLLDKKEAQALYADMNALFLPGHRLYVIAPSEGDFEKHFGHTADQKRKIYNGMITCQVFQYFKNLTEN